MGLGETLTGVLENDVVDEHPDTGALIAGLRIPHWDFILQSAARGYEVTELGYLGVDIVIDRDLGPLILEMNARPGLNIQIANCEGLARRITRIDEIHNPKEGPAERARIAKREFPAERQTSIPFDEWPVCVRSGGDELDDIRERVRAQNTVPLADRILERMAGSLIDLGADMRVPQRREPGRALL